MPRRSACWSRCGGQASGCWGHNKHVTGHLTQRVCPCPSPGAGHTKQRSTALAAQRHELRERLAVGGVWPGECSSNPARCKKPFLLMRHGGSLSLLLVRRQSMTSSFTDPMLWGRHWAWCSCCWCACFLLSSELRMARWQRRALFSSCLHGFAWR